jgi:hypothetical protein
MLRTAIILVLLFGSAAALAFDNGDHGDIPDNIRSWFKSVRSPSGVPCCNIADGHRTQWEPRADGRFWIPNPLNEQEWIPVPPEAVVYGAGNPTGDAVVWWVSQGGPVPYIRCFVPGGGV